MSQKTLTLEHLEEKLKIVSLNYWEHVKFAHELNQGLGTLDSRYLRMQKIVNQIAAEKSLLHRQIEQFTQEKSATD